MCREWRIDGTTDFERHIALIPTRHHHQNIDVAIFMRRPVGVGAEEDDLFRVEMLSDLAGEFANDSQGDIRAAIPAMRLLDGFRLGSHVSSLHRRGSMLQSNSGSELLHKAVKAGYNDYAHVAKDTDLDPLRNRADFKKLLASLQPKPKGNAPPREPAPPPREKK